jgi:hypothetical protein
MANASDYVDVLIIGAGPAGSVLRSTLFFSFQQLLGEEE